MRAAPLLLALAMLLGCGNPLSPSDLNEWAAARARWVERGGRNYEFELQVSCFCPPELSGWTRVVVAGGEVVDARAVSAEPGAPSLTLQFWPTIDKLFTLVPSAGRDRSVSRVEVEYDALRGYPTLLSLQPARGVVDGGVTYHVRNLLVIACVDPGSAEGASPGPSSFVGC